MLDAYGARWRPERIGTGNHHRACAEAHSLTVDGRPMASRPVTLGHYLETVAELFPAGQRWCGHDASSLALGVASQWAAVLAFCRTRCVPPRVRLDNG